MTVSRETCIDYERSSRLEWLVTNGTGAFAMGTVSGANTRRYHGYLVVRLRPPVGRYVLLAKFDEEVLVDGRVIALGTNQYPGSVHPTGYRYLDRFRPAPHPVWSWAVDGLHLEKRLTLVEGRQAVVVEYRADRACRLIARPFLAFRDYHSLTRANRALNSAISELGSGVTMQPYPDLPALTFARSGGSFQPGGSWFYHFEYLVEYERGLEFREDLYCPGAFEFEMAPGRTVWVVAGIEVPDRWSFPSDRDETTLAGRLAQAAGQFVVRRSDGSPTVLAGYPWFTDWGRDTMIALPGLLIGRGRLDEARQIITGFLQHLRQGLIPNRFPDHGPPEYNTVDATLWMFPAVWAYQQAGGDASFFHPAAKEIIDWHLRGTLYGIGVDPADGLLAAGNEETNLTWMDARVNGRPVTPRHGKPVEVNALWYNALRMTESWARERGEKTAAYSRAARRVKASFEQFWNAGRSCLCDVLGPAGPDPAVRPNQILAVSLPFSVLDKSRQQEVVLAVERHLLTPFGLRTLAPGEPGYQGRYTGGPEERDRAYHQGTVWPWLMGPHVTAYLRAFGWTKKNLAYCRSLVEAFVPELDRGCLGQVGEIYEGDPPHRPVGAPAQAWSVAALLEALTALETTDAAPSHPGSPTGRRRKTADRG
jgi:glycogen debranching enzyme